MQTTRRRRRVIPSWWHKQLLGLSHPRPHRDRASVSEPLLQWSRVRCLTGQVRGFGATRSIAGLRETYWVSLVCPSQRVAGAQTVWLGLVCVWSARIAPNVPAAQLRVPAPVTGPVRGSAFPPRPRCEYIFCSVNSNLNLTFGRTVRPRVSQAAATQAAPAARVRPPVTTGTVRRPSSWTSP